MLIDRLTFLFTFPILHIAIRLAYYICKKHGFTIPGEVRFKVELAEYEKSEKGWWVLNGQCRTNYLIGVTTLVLKYSALTFVNFDFWRTAFHEICHGMLNQYQREYMLPYIGSVVGDSTTRFSDDPEEAICDHFAGYAANGFTWEGYTFSSGAEDEITRCKWIILRLQENSRV